MRRIHHILCCLLAVAAMTPDVQAVQPYPIDTVNGTAVYKYTPEKSIGLYRISVRFGVPQDVIIQWNPQLQERGPQLGETLLIPVKQSKKELAQQEKLRQQTEQEEEKKQETLAQPAQEQETQESMTPVVTKRDTAEAVKAQADTAATVVAEEPGGDAVMTETDGTVLKIGMMLPLRADVAERDAADDRFFDFYAGSLLAVRQAESAGQKIEVHVYDIDKGLKSIDKCLTDEFIHKADALIGPVYPAQVEYMSETVLRDSLLMVVPFASNIPSISDNPYIMQFNPDPETEAERLAEHIASRENNVNCVVVEAKESQIPESVRQIRKALEKKNLKITQVSLRQILNDSLDLVLKDTMENILIFNTEKYGNLQVLMPHVVTASQRYAVTLLSKYSWQQENIPVGQIYTSIFSGEDTEESANYEAAWQHYFGYQRASFLPRYDLLGYDLMTQMIGMLQMMQDIADPAFCEVIKTRTYHGLQSDIKYKRATEHGGYINNEIQVKTR